MQMNTRSKVSVLAAEHLDVRYADNTIVTQLSLSIAPGKVTALTGTNGSGKSTLLKALARLLKPHQGTVYLDGVAISTLSSAAVARQLAVLPQSPEVPASLTVRELVEQGRYPHAGPLRMLRRQDHAAIDEALHLTGMTSFQHRMLDTLSGGERQRAWIALALAQSTPILMLDEPTTFLDVRHQLEILELVRRLNQERGMTIVVVLHDLNQAAKYADRMIVLQKGRIVADGEPDEVLTIETLRQAFGIHANVIQDPESGSPVFLPYAIASDNRESVQEEKRG
ncbi:MULTISPECIES: heme ABC transporter ATP-binding protein [Paenibacillus]|uniref:Heme ABC transporter ATP-binding protein n=1 Tax=Paenibacillus campinasensis TaxID=66347 RepID=A0A268F093_9BACL|nr:MULTISPECIES: heme ABC transporter ATP-binding protein [Paenibacillus]MUG65506.1 heme ABC transporter ATP-binding protein [Paenibacillus campinasensis]PAD78795.1 heme ABC transporter ATP-binding protein [Paenibacillus campinasensis]PAK53935.1 heme ABC transporter ATP-binding protein [Paenibacillus sp. 7541]